MRRNTKKNNHTTENLVMNYLENIIVLLCCQEEILYHKV